MQAKIPGYRDKLPATLDFWGRERSISSGLGSAYDALVPIRHKSTENTQPIDRELDRLNYYPTPADQISVGIESEDPTPRGRRMTPTQREERGQAPVPLRNLPDVKNRYTALQSATPANELLANMEGVKGGGSAAARRILMAAEGQNLREVLNDLVKGESQVVLDQIHPEYRGRSYADLADQEKVDAIRQTITAFRSAAKHQVVREFPVLQELRRSKPMRRDLADPSPFSGVN
jgi:hypothetical protein